MPIFSIPASGLQTSILRQSVSANNLANLDTNGFKSFRLDQATVKGGGAAATGTSRDQSQGALRTDTGHRASAAIVGNGQFRVQTPDGERFTRDGGFHINANGQVVTANGEPLADGIVAPPNSSSVRFASDGTATASNGQQVGQVELAKFNNPDALVEEGGNQAAATAGSGPAMVGAPGTGGRGKIVTGAVEVSNVNPITETVELMKSRVAIEANIEVLDAQDQTLETLLGIRR